MHGVSTRRSNPTSGSDGALTGVSCTSAKSCTAVGSYKDGPDTVTLADGWNGAKWALQPTPNPEGTVSELLGVSCSPMTGCGVTGYGEGASSVYSPLAEGDA